MCSFTQALLSGTFYTSDKNKEAQRYDIKVFETAILNALVMVYHMNTSHTKQLLLT